MKPRFNTPCFQTAPRLGSVCTLVVLLLGGCLVIPVNQPTAGSRQNISEEKIAALQNGVTTKRDVVLALGEPDWVSLDDRSYCFHWSRVRWFWMIAVAGGYSGGVIAGDISREQYLNLTFDDEDRLQTSSLSKSWGSTLDNGAQHVNQAPGRSVYSIDLQPRPHPAIAVAAETPRDSFNVSEVRDRRTERERVGKFTSLGLKVGDIQAALNVPDYLRRELITEVYAAGHPIADPDADLTIEPTLTRFWVWTESTPFYFDVIVEIECDLACTRADAPGQSVSRNYSSRIVERTHAIPGSEFFSKAAGGCVDNLLAKIREDAIWSAVRVKDE
jgi:outer membrane protein assembly factor BamE (lipoprotein component of BamABCDE complex)